MAKRRSEIGKKGKHGREGLEIDIEGMARRRKKTILMVVAVMVVIILILASLYYIFIFNKEPEEEEKEIFTTDTPHNGVYPNETVTYRFTIYNPEDEDDIFAPILLGLPSDWEIQLPTTVHVKGKESKIQEFTIKPSLATGLNRTYPFTLNVTSANTQITYTLKYQITVFKPLVDVELSSDTQHKETYPSEYVNFNVTIYNPNNFVDIFTPSIFGMPSDWKVTLPDNITVNENNTNETQFFVVPSKSTLNKTYSFQLNVTSGTTHRPYSYKFNLTVLQIYGVELLCYNNSHDADPGRPTYYAILVKNTGNGEDTISVSYNSSHLPANWSISFEFNSMDLTAFDSKVVICTVNTHSNTSKGRYDIDIIGTSSSGRKGTTRVNTSLIKDFDEVTAVIGDLVQVDYIGTYTDGGIFDTSISEVANNNDYPKGEDFHLRSSYAPLKTYVGPSDPDTSDEYIEVITGFWEGIVGMKVNETNVVRLPSEKGYNDGKVRIFEITLISIDN